MRKVLLATVIAIGLSNYALAQPQPQSAFVPFVVNESDERDLMQYLNDNVPPRYGTPIANWVNGMKQRAAAARASAEKKAEAPAEKKPEEAVAPHLIHPPK